MAQAVVRLLDLARRKQTLLKRALERPKVPPKIELEDLQGLILRGYGGLQSCRYVMLAARDGAAANQWLAQVSVEIATGVPSRRERLVQIAFTYAGLRRLGLAAGALEGFSQSFIEGMATEHRSRLFGDVGASAPERWRWGGPNTQAVHAVLIVYAVGESPLSEYYSKLREGWERSGWHEVLRVDCGSNLSREHFGFADGISQPAIAGYHDSTSKFLRIQAGEFVLGYPNEYDLYTSRPMVEPSSVGAGLLAPDVEGSRQRDFGRNGTYLALRQLRQDVVGFRKTLERLTEHSDGSSNVEARDRLAARIVGRWPSGAPLIKTPWKEEAALARENEFGYHREDPHGLLCPMGAHVRRANPRDALAPNPGTEDSMIVNRRHRIIRRGRSYGPELPEGEVDDQDRGLMFVAVNANLARQFEFIQASWLNDPRFNGFRHEADPLIGSSSDNAFTVQATPVRCRYTGLPRFVSVVGGAYFFLPGIAALKYLAGLSGRAREGL